MRSGKELACIPSCSVRRVTNVNSNKKKMVQIEEEEGNKNKEELSKKINGSKNTAVESLVFNVASFKYDLKM